MKNHSRIAFLLIAFIAALSLSCSDELNTADIGPIQNTVPITDPGDGGGGGGGGGGGSSNYKKDIYYFHRGDNTTSIFYGAKDNGATTWPYYSGLTGVEGTTEGPETVFFNNQIYCFYRGSEANGNLPARIRFKTSSDGVNWSSERVAGDATVKTEEAPAAVVFNGRLYIYYAADGGVTNSERRAIRVLVYDGVNWTHKNGGRLVHEIPGGGVTNGVTAAVLNGNVYVIYTRPTRNQAGSSGRMWAIRSSSGLDFSDRIDLRKDAKLSASAMTLSGTTYIVFTDASTGNISVLSTSDYTGFATKTIRQNGVDLRSDDRPDIVYDGSRFIIVFKARSSRNLLQAYSSSFTSSSWTQTTIPGTSQSGPCLVQTEW